jgi:hypothetical protein
MDDLSFLKVNQRKEVLEGGNFLTNVVSLVRDASIDLFKLSPSIERLNFTFLPFAILFYHRVSPQKGKVNSIVFLGLCLIWNQSSSCAFLQPWDMSRSRGGV